MMEMHESNRVFKTPKICWNCGANVKKLGELCSSCQKMKDNEESDEEIRV